VNSNAELDISIVLPVHNEAGHLEAELTRIHESMNSSSYSWELIIVDDGSSDGSGDIAVGRANTRVIRAERNHGAGTARRIGTDAAHGRIVVWSDADMSYPNHRIPELVEAMGTADQIVGARTTEEGTFKLLRVPAKWTIRRLASYLTKTKIPDLNSGFRAMRRDVALQYTHQLPAGFSCVTTITMAFLMNGYRVTYLPIDYETRAGTSKFHWLADTRRYALQVIRMMLSYDPLRVILPVTTTSIPSSGMTERFDTWPFQVVQASELRSSFTSKYICPERAKMTRPTSPLTRIRPNSDSSERFTAPEISETVNSGAFSPARGSSIRSDIVHLVTRVDAA